MKNPVSGEPRTDALYPTWLLPEPLKLQVLRDSPVYQGRLQRLAGPQRLEAAGWLAPSDQGGVMPAAIRDYFIYRSPQAGLLWIYRERLPVAAPRALVAHAWYLHGFFA